VLVAVSQDQSFALKSAKPSFLRNNNSNSSHLNYIISLSLFVFIRLFFINSILFSTCSM